MNELEQIERMIKQASEPISSTASIYKAYFAPGGPVAKLVERVKELEARFTHKQETLADLEARGYDNPGAKVLCHKWLDWECVDSGCQSLFLKEAKEELRATRKSYSECLADWQRASAELKALRKLTTPQPIETAPRDGPILGFDGKTWHRYWPLKEDWVCGDFPSPIYWLPMPQAPEVKE